jgi:hypothetical protein
MRRFAFVLTVLAAVTVAACRPTATLVDRIDAVWLAADDVYVVRSVDSDRREIWRRAPDGETFVVKGSDIPNACGPVDFLFRAGQGRLGIGLRCPDRERLVGYTPATGSFDVLRDIGSAATVTLRPDGRAGYRGDGANGCWTISHFGEGSGIRVGAASTDGDCGGTGSAKSPRLLPNGDLAYLGTDAAPAEQPVRDDMRLWHIYVSEANGARPVGPALVGFPEMDVSADGTTAVVALATAAGGRLMRIDLSTGNSREVARSSHSIGSPSISPDGRRVVYIEDYENAKIATI